MNKYNVQRLKDIIEFNPQESLKKGTIAKKIPMEKIFPFQRKIIGYEYAEYNSGPKFRNKDTLLAKITPCLENGKTAYVDILKEKEIAFGSTEFIVLRAKENQIDEEFLFYLAISPALRNKAISCMEGTSGRKRVNDKILQEEVLPIPPYNIQKKISFFLSSIDAKISLNNRINEELESMAKTLYDYWFVQFNFPNEEGKPYKSSGGKMVWNEKPKREIPEGWEVNTISSLIDHSKNGDWGKETPSNTYNYKVQCIRGADINYINGKGNSILPLRYILNKNNHKTLEQGDCIIEISGGSPTQSTGRIALITEKVLERFSEPLICSNFCQAITLKDTSNSFYFYYLWNQLYNNNIFFNYEGKTSGIKNLLFDSFTNSTYWSFPPKSIILSFNKIIDFIHQKRELLLHENHHLSSLRDWLLPMLMNGQVMIRKEANTSGNPPATTAS